MGPDAPEAAPAQTGPSEEDLRAERYADSRDLWGQYQQQQRDIAERYETSLSDLDTSTRIRGLSERAASNRRIELGQTRDRELTALRSGATYGLLRDVMREQGGEGTVEEYFTSQFGTLDNPLKTPTMEKKQQVQPQQRAQGFTQEAREAFDLRRFGYGGGGPGR